MAEDLKDAIKQNAEGPRQAGADGVNVQQHSLDDQIRSAQLATGAADKYLAAHAPDPPDALPITYLFHKYLSQDWPPRRLVAWAAEDRVLDGLDGHLLFAGSFRHGWPLSLRHPAPGGLGRRTTRHAESGENRLPTSASCPIMFVATRRPASADRGFIPWPLLFRALPRSRRSRPALLRSRDG